MTGRGKVTVGLFAAGLAWCAGCALAVRHVERRILEAAGAAANEVAP